MMSVRAVPSVPYVLSPTDMLLPQMMCNVLWTACSGERQKLYAHLRQDLRNDWLEELKRAMREFDRVRTNQRELHEDVDLGVLRHARLVGMTTSGVANKQNLVAAMAPKVRLSHAHRIPSIKDRHFLKANILYHMTAWAHNHINTCTVQGELKCSLTVSTHIELIVAVWSCLAIKLG